LLRQLGVNLTANALQELRAEDTARVQAENSLARGIAAQRQGTTVEALSYFFQAAAFNPTIMSEAMNRISTTSASIAGGNLGQNVRNRLQVHDEWRIIVNAAKTFYASHLPYEFVYGTTPNRGTIDFERRTTNLSIELSIIPTDAWRTINDLRKGLNSARQSGENWNFNLNQIEPRRIVIRLEIINEHNIVLSNASHTFNNPSERERVNATLHFNNVNAENITDILTVRVVSINEIPAQRAGETGFIQISNVTEYN